MNQMATEDSDADKRADSGEIVAVELYVKDEHGNFVPVEISPPDDGEPMGVLMAQRSMHIGPLPSVEQFRAYGEVVPDAPERILQMAEKEQKAYHSFMEKQLAGRVGAIA